MNTCVETTYGPVLGYTEEGIIKFHAIPYAKAPVDDLRFCPPEPPETWTDVLDASKRGAVPPQYPSDLDRPMGPVTLPFSEDCLTVAVSTPSVRGARPVAVWFHGGANCYCGGDLPWYDGASLAASEDIVVVNVGFRLGVLGFLCVEDVIPEPVSILDQIMALSWVQANIRRFGGDPGRVTVFGQSAGANAIAHILSREDTDGLFQQIVLESPSLGRGNHLQADAYEVGRAVLSNLGIQTAGEEALRSLQSCSVGELLRAADEIPGELKARHQGMYFKPVMDAWHTPEQTARRAAEMAVRRKIRVMIGFTRDELWAFVEERDPDTLDALRRGQTLRYDAPGQCFARSAAEGGCEVWKYAFDWAAPDSVYGSCHCLELPFVFGNLDAWDAPFLKGAEAGEMKKLKTVMQNDFGTFFRGETLSDGEWPRYLPETWLVKHFDNASNPVQQDPVYAL